MGQTSGLDTAVLSATQAAVLQKVAAWLSVSSSLPGQEWRPEFSLNTPSPYHCPTVTKTGGLSRSTENWPGERGHHGILCPGSIVAPLFFTILNFLLEFIIQKYFETVMEKAAFIFFSASGLINELFASIRIF